MTLDLAPAHLVLQPAYAHAARRRASLSASSALTGGARMVVFALAGSLSLLIGQEALADPQGGMVTAGAASISGGPGSTTINQASQNAIINWQSFNIGQGESVQFVQPNSTAVALNRVLSADPSSILGSLSANGRVFLVNPNGILFGANAQVNVGGLVASSLNLSDADFMAGRYRFSGGGGQVLNEGAISADGGYVALLGADVSNQGVISARLGVVALAAGEAITLDVAGDGLLQVAVDAGAVNALAQNGGLIVADGGQVLLTAQSAGALLRTVVNNTGVIQARSVQNRGGVIMLLGDTQTGGVTTSGVLDASGLNRGETGGDIVLTGHDVTLANGARLDASGDLGGGQVFVGGGYQGKDPDIANATSTTMAAGATITADAVSSGDGGDVILWSDGDTSAAGVITARGGAAFGNGGFVETSGRHVALADTLSVNTLAPQGRSGLWLLDPIDYTIAITGGDETPGQVTISLATSNRLIMADHDITVADAVTWTTAQTLELRAGNDVIVDGAMTASTSGSLIRLVAGHDIDVNAAMTASGDGSLIELNAGHDVNLNAAITASGGGAVMIRADNDGTGGPNGGTVHLSPLFPVTSTSKTIYYSPENGYASPNLYTGFTSYMWAFVAAVDKMYDGSTAATATFRGDPTVGGTKAVSLTGGSMSFVDKNVGPAKPVAFTGYTLTGANAAAYALFTGVGMTTAAITPAPLIVTANSASKTYGQALTFAGSAFTSTGLVAGETIGRVTEVSAGSPAGASVAGGPYAITPSNAEGGSFSASNYTIAYVDGLLTIAPAVLVVTAGSTSKTYGEVVTFTGQEFTTSGLQNGDTIGGVTLVSSGAGATAGVVGGPYVITAANAVGGSYSPSNYATSYVGGALTVTPAVLLVTAESSDKPVGVDLEFDGSEFTTSGLQNGETVGSATITSPGATSTATVSGGPYVVQISNAGGGTYTPSNYTTTYASGSLTVLAAVTPPIVTPPVVTPPVVPVVNPPVVTPPVTPIITPPVTPVVNPPVVTPPVVPVVNPPVVTPPVVTPPVTPIVTPPVTPVVNPPVVTPPVVPIVTPPVVPVVNPPVVTPPIIPVVNPPVVVPPVIPLAISPSDGGSVTPLVVTPVQPPVSPKVTPLPGLQLAVLDGGITMPLTEASLETPATSEDEAPAVAPVATAMAPVARPAKQDRN